MLRNQGVVCVGEYLFSSYVENTGRAIIGNISDRLLLDPLEVIGFYYNSETYKRFIECVNPMDFTPGELTWSVIGEMLGKEVNVKVNDGLKVSIL